MELGTSSNARFSPRSWSTPLPCAIPSDQSYSFSLSDRAYSYCPKLEDNEFRTLPSGEELDAIATLYAPVLFFHPLESYTLMSIDTALQNFEGQVKFALNQSVLSDTVDMDLLLNSSRDYNLAFQSEDYYIQQELSRDFVTGDGYDPDSGQSRASIYYNAFAHDTNAAWVFNYWFYYPYSGSTSTSIVTSHPNASNVNWYTAQIRPFGEHQGDWQSMSVAICPFSLNRTSSDSSTDDSVRERTLQQEELDDFYVPIAVSYEQHGFREALDCTMGQCTLYENTTHPVGFVARDSHATYPVSAVHMIYTQWETNFLLRLSGVYGVDQTNFLRSTTNATNDSNSSSTQFHYFFPNATNVLRHENPSEIIANVSDKSTYWRTFPGRFGGTELWDYGAALMDSNFSYDGTLTEIPFPTCTNENGTAVVDCPSADEDRAFHIVLQMLHVAVDNGLDNLPELGQDLFQSLVSYWSSVTGRGPYGPATKSSFRQWMPGINAPVRNDINATVSSAAYCASLLFSNVTKNLSSGIEKVTIHSNVIGICFTMAYLVIVNLSFILHPKLASKSTPVLRFDATSGMVQEPDWEQAWQTFRPCFIYCIFYVVTMIGAALYIVGYVQLLDIAEAAFNTDLSSARTLATLFGLGVIVIDTFLVVFIWFPLRATWHKRWSLYYDLMGNDIQRDHYQRRIGRFCGHPARICFHVAYGALFNSLILAVLCVLIGSIDVGTAYIFGDFCLRFVTTADAICLDLHQWGIVIPCGAPIDDFCNSWASRSSIVTLWGGTIVVAGQYYLIDSCGAASAALKSFPCAMKLLPSREVYQQSFQGNDVNIEPVL